MEITFYCHEWNEWPLIKSIFFNDVTANILNFIQWGCPEVSEGGGGGGGGGDGVGVEEEWMPPTMTCRS